jgi:shikimate kinase
MAATSDRVILVGPRGAGKSTVGPLLAARLGVSFVDTDRVVEGEAGRTIAEVWADFREREAKVLGRVLAGPKAVVAAGGGAVLWDGFRDAARGWTVVWLDAAPEILARRLRGDPRPRPSLTGRPADEEIGDVARARAPLYASVARVRVATDRLGADAVAEEIVRLLRAAARGKAD